MYNIDRWALAFLVWSNFPILPIEFVGLREKLRDVAPVDWGKLEIWSLLQREFFVVQPFWHEQLPPFVDRAQSLQLQLVLFGEAGYPRMFYELSLPPLAMTWLGQSGWQEGGHFAVVGSREITPQSKRWMELHLPKVLNQYPFLLLSGGARGTDQAAHAICLRLQMATVCFLPSGLLNPYPQEIKKWLSAIVEGGGAVVSPFAPLQGMRKQFFYLRNQLIASLSGLVLAIDGRRRSGTMITARAAMEMGRAVAILPQHPLHSNSLGGLDLLYDGAFPLRDHLDLEALCRLYVKRL